MSVQNPNRVVTKQDLKDFYDGIYPYLNRVPDAGFTPVGTIIAVMGTTAPTNYLACNGQIVNIADYKELANYFESQFGSKNYFGGNGTTTFGIPDLRGEFLRGTGTNSHANQGSGAAVGTHQDATAMPYEFVDVSSTNKIALSGNSSEALRISNIDSQQMRGTGDSKWLYSTEGTVGPGPSTIWDSVTIRPTNTSVLYCIATKNIYLNQNLEYNYSADEQIVGVWTDGKPIYQKTTACTFTETIVDGTGTTQTYSYTQALNIDTLVDMDIVAYFSLAWHKLNVSWIQTIDDESKVYEARAWITLNKELRVRSNSSLFNNCNFNVTLKYTKTTD